MSDPRIYDRLPLEVAQALTELVRWREHMLAGRHECAARQLMVMADTTDELIEWQGRQHNQDRIHPDAMGDDAFARYINETRRKAAERPRPPLRVVPRPPEDDD